MNNLIREVQVSDITSIVTKGTTPTTIGGQFTEDGINFIKVESIGENGEYNYDKFEHIDHRSNQLLARSMLVADDVLFSIAGAIGRSAIVSQDILPANINQAIAILRPNKAHVMPLFLFYITQTRNFQNQAYGKIVQAAQANVNLTQLKKINISLPSLIIQENIIDVLSKYDDLLKTNRRRIQLLEESARLLFREWFIYFKFPGHEKVKMVDGVPEGWEKEPIKKYFNTSSGGTPSRKHPEFYDGDINWVKTQELDEKYIFDTDEKVTEEAINNSSAKIFPKNTLLISIYGNGNIGRTGIIAEPSASNQACVALLPKKQHYHYIYLQQYLQMIRDYLIGLSQGAAQTNISQDTLRKVKILMPDELLMNKFLSIAEPLYEQIKNLQRQNKNLVQARDLLLPRLMSGAIEV